MTKLNALKRIVLAILTAILLTAGGVRAEDRKISVPSTISPEAQQVLKAIIKAKPYTRAVPELTDLEAWRQLYDATEKATKQFNANAVDRAGGQCPVRC